jgi:hypothetical protein
MSSTYAMTQADKADRRKQIVSLWHEGVAPYDIGRKFGLTPNYVRAVLRAAGETEFEPQAYGSQVDGIWSMSESDRRLAFAERAAQGARLQLERNENK